MSKKTVSAWCLFTTVFFSPITLGNTQLPELGVTAASTLSIGQEIAFGDAYIRAFRASAPVINDPILNEYLNQIGHKLVAHSQNVRTPFSFHLLTDPDINASAFFGGHIALNSGLFLHAQNESEFASVISHEIAHVTQRHLARRMESQAKSNPATLAAMLGSALLTIAAPQAGMAALQTTGALAIQGQLNHSRSSEEEADRFGLKSLADAGFDPHAMPRFFERLAEQSRHSSKPPTLLLTHPLPESRISDTRIRSEHYSKMALPPSEAYHLAKARVLARHLNYSVKEIKIWLENQAKNNTALLPDAQSYLLALVALDNGRLDEAEQRLTSLLQKAPANRFYLDAMTDVDIQKKRPQNAIARLQTALKQTPDNPTLQLNLINSYLEANEPKTAESLLIRYTAKHPDDTNGWYLLAKSYAKQNKRDGELAAQGEISALSGKWDQAITDYTQASRVLGIHHFDQARYLARIQQLYQEKSSFEALK